MPGRAFLQLLPAMAALLPNLGPARIAQTQSRAHPDDSVAKRWGQCAEECFGAIALPTAEVSDSRSHRRSAALCSYRRVDFEHRYRVR